MGQHEFLLKYKKNGTEEWNQFAFSDVVQVGSGESCQLRLGDGSLNEIHFEIRENPTGVFLKEFSSENDSQAVEVENGFEQPEAIEFDQSFKAGQYDFIFTLNQPALIEDEKLFQQISDGVKGFGIAKVGLIFLGIIVVAVVSGILVSRFWVNNKPPSDSEVIATEVAEIAEEMPTVAAIISTEVFEIVTTMEVDEIFETIVVPGAGDISLDSIQLDGSTLNISDIYELTMNPGEGLGMVFDLVGENVGYVYQYTGMVVDNVVLATSLEFISADDEEVIEGIVSPAWNESEIPVNLEWTPFIYEIHDGQQSVMGLLVPEVYGASEETAIYHLSGVFQKKDSDSEYKALLRFDGTGQMLDLLTFGTVDSERPTPYKVIPKAGDEFTIYHQQFVFSEDSSEEIVIEFSGNSIPAPLIDFWKGLVVEKMGEDVFAFGPGKFEDVTGETLIFSTEGIWWTKFEGAAGEFVTGLAVSDLDGNYFVGYIPLHIIE